MDNAWQDLLNDLAAESAVLQGALESLNEAFWGRASPAEGWTLRDCVVHLAESDDSATAIVRGEPLLQRARRDGVLTAGQQQSRQMPSSQLRDWYRKANAQLVDALHGLHGDERLTWAGRPMSARSFATARLMEHWSHGLDILEAAGVPAVDSGRLHHIAHLGFITRDFAYRTHGLRPPTTPLYVELASPGGEVWCWGPADATDRIYGTAGDFCRVVTQRIHPDDTTLRCEGPHAREFLAVAQAFAGPPGSGRPPRKAPKP